MKVGTSSPSASSESNCNLAILEEDALRAWIPELKLGPDSEGNGAQPPIRDRDIVDDLELAVRDADPSSDLALLDATRLSLGRWLRVHCAQHERSLAVLSDLKDPNCAPFCSVAENEIWDRSAELETLQSTMQDEDAPLRSRCWAAIELGLLYEECDFEADRALESFQKALEFIPDHFVALELAWRSADVAGDKNLALELLSRRMTLSKALKLPEDPGLRRSMGRLWSTAAQVREHLDEVYELAPQDSEVAQRRIAWAFIEGQFSRLPELFLAMAQQEHDAPELKLSALHLTMLTAEHDAPLDPHFVDQVFFAYAQADSAPPSSRAGAQAMMRELAEQNAREKLKLDPERSKRLQDALHSLADAVDDPRDQALIHEQLARVRLSVLRREKRTVLTANDCQPTLQSLQLCADRLPDLRWNREATAEVLTRVQNFPALAQHFENWASDTNQAPERASLLLRAGQIYEDDLGEFALALECYRQAHAEQPRDPHCLRALGGCYARSGQWSDAVSVLHQQLDQSQDNDEREGCLRRIVHIARYELEDADLALASLQQLNELRPEDLGALYLTATIARREDRIGVLVDALERLLTVAHDPRTQSALASELAIVLDHRLDRHEEAMHWHSHALAATPDYAPSRSELTRLKLQRGEYREALEQYLDQGLESLSPELVFQALSVAEHMDADDPMRVELYAMAADQLSPSPALHEKSAHLLLAHDQADRAYTMLERLPESSFAPLASEQHYQLGCVALKLVQSDSEHCAHWSKTTLRHWQRCLELEPEHYGALDGLYHLYMEQGDLQSLDALYAKIEDQVDPISRVQILAQRARMAAQDPQAQPSAKALYEKALITHPQDSVLRFELEQVLRVNGSARSLFNNLVRQAGEIQDAKLKSALAIYAAETLLDASSGAELKTVGRLVLSALKGDPGNPHAVGLLEQVLNLDASVLPIRAAVSARAVRAQSDEERAIFFAESAELLEQGGYYRDAGIAYRAAQELVEGTQLLEQSIERVKQAASQMQHGKSPSSRRVTTQPMPTTDQQRAVHRAIEEDDEIAAGRIVAQLTTQLAQNPNQPDAIYLLVQLASAHLQRATILRSLAQLFVRLTERGCRYRAGVLLGIHSEVPAQGVSYLNAALIAKPDGLSAREALLGRFREMGQIDEQAETIRALLSHPRFAEARKPALQRELVYLLADDNASGEEALEHCAELLREHTHDTGLIQLYSKLLERHDRNIDAARALDPLLSHSPSPALVHAVRLRQAHLYAKRSDTMDSALKAVREAVVARPEEPESLSLMLSLFGEAGRARELDSMVETIRVATVQRMTHGEAMPHDLENLSRLLAGRNHPATRRVQVLHEALTPEVLVPKSLRDTDHSSNPLFRDPNSRSRARASEEPAALMELVALIESVHPGLSYLLDDLGPASILPLPSSAPVSHLGPLMHDLAKALKIDTPVLTASSGRTVSALLIKTPPELRLASRLWATGDLELSVGALYVGVARYLSGAASLRSLSAPDLDLLLASAFDLAGVFHPLSAEADERRLDQISKSLSEHFRSADLRKLQKLCIALSEQEFPPGAARSACLMSDLRLAVLLSKDPRTILLAAAAFDGNIQGEAMLRITESPTASALLGDFLSDDAMNRAEAPRLAG